MLSTVQRKASEARRISVIAAGYLRAGHSLTCSFSVEQPSTNLYWPKPGL